MPRVENAWSAVTREADRLNATDLRRLFAEDPRRFETCSRSLDDLLIDFSKEKIDAAALAALLDLAAASGLEERRAEMFSGSPINNTEGRAALHTALRGDTGKPLLVAGEDVMPRVQDGLSRFLGFAEDIRGGIYASPTGAPFSDVVHLGIGGSDLGPAMAVAALAPYDDGPRVHFVSNVDGAHLADTLRPLDPSRTFAIVASKSFTTLETMTNARSLRAWLEEGVGAQANAHVAAVTANPAAAKAFGVDETRIFPLWDWVGGRYSVWSAIGLPLAIAIGAAHFQGFLEGARQMDAHFREAPLERNLPVLLALIGIWRRNAMGWPSVCVMPYDQRLALLPAYLQQLEMESNGKGTTRDGGRLVRASAPIVWGAPGTSGQHSFMQQIHQGTDCVPVDFLFAAEAQEELGNHHAKLVASALAQAAALAFGKTEAEVRQEMAGDGASPDTIDAQAPHRSFPGDRPSTTILYRRLDPKTLGRLLALYEHKVFAQGVLWNVNSFDQWGVELGKALARQLIPAVAGEDSGGSLDQSTRGLLSHFHTLGSKSED